MIDFEGLLTSYLTFLFLVLRLKTKLSDSKSDRSRGYYWDLLGEIYLDILSNLGEKLIKYKVWRQMRTLETPDDVERHIEKEMHNLCAHFHKIVSESILDKLEPITNAHVVCLKKYGSPCHRFAMWVPR